MQYFIVVAVKDQTRLKHSNGGFPKVGHYRNLGGIEVIFETYSRYSGVDDGEQKKVLRELKSRFFRCRVGGGHIFFNI